jgi:hypothetical protein
MAEDELLNIGEILLRYRNYLYEDDREILGGMLSAKEAEQAINAYTTNKIIEARIEEKLKAAGRLEALRKHGSRAESHLEKMIVVYVHEVAELKALNHRKER